MGRRPLIDGTCIMVDWLSYLEIPAPAAHADIEQAVRSAHLPVPDDVEKVLTEHQGQVPAKDAVDLGNGGAAPFGPILVVSATAPDSVDHSYSVSYAMKVLAEWSRSADGKPVFFPFASDTASGWYCLDQRDPAQPVVLIDMNYGPQDRGAVTPVAPTVTALLAKLR